MGRCRKRPESLVDRGGFAGLAGAGHDLQEAARLGQTLSELSDKPSLEHLRRFFHHVTLSYRLLNTIYKLLITLSNLQKQR
jgi:hypothetical protein